MNMTPEAFIKGMERSAENLPGILDDRIDLDLREEYRSQIQWMTENAPDIRERAEPDLRKRYDEAMAKIMETLVDAFFDSIAINDPPPEAP